MRVENGFKETEIGLLPAEWEVKPLRDLVATRTSNRDPRGEADKAFRYIEISSISNESYRIENWRVLKGAEAPSRARKIIRAGDTLFSTVRPYLRNIAQVPSNLDDEIGTTGFCVLRTESEQLDPDYLYFYTLTNNFVNRVVAHQSGSSYPAVSNRDVLSEPIPLPPLPEQRRIAGALRAIQEAIAAQEDVIATARELKRSLMERVFTYGPGAEPAPTKETGSGQIPQHWNIVPFGEIADFKNGINFKREQKGQGILTVDVLNMYAGSITVQMDNLYRVDIEDLRDHYILHPGDVLIVRSSLKQEGVAWPALFSGYREEVTFCGFLIRARLTADVIDPEFLVNYLRLPSTRKSLVSRSDKVAITNINQGNLKGLDICFPSRPEQQQIIRLLRAADAKIAAEEQRKAALEEVFRSALEGLITARVRLK